MQQSLASLNDAVLRRETSSQHSPGEDDTSAQRPVFQSRDSTSRSSPSTIPIAPIQAVRNMNSWITGQRPDGKLDIPTSSIATSEAAFDEHYLRV